MAILTIYDNQGNTINVPAIKGAPGDQGLPGKSAYQVAVDNGFSGTESEWLASLKGEKGDTGDSTTLGPVSTENTTTPPSGADVAVAINNITISGAMEFLGETNDTMYDGYSYSGIYVDNGSRYVVADSGNVVIYNNKTFIFDGNVWHELGSSDFSGDYNDLTNKPTIPSKAVDIGALPANTQLFSGNYNDLTNKPNLATVATSGNYNDLTNKPTIPSTTTDIGALPTSSKITSIDENSTNDEIPTAKAVYDLFNQFIEDVMEGEY